MRDWISISAVPSQKQSFIDDTYAFWDRQFKNAIPEYAPELPQVQPDGDIYVPWQQASEIMYQQMKVFKQVNGGVRRG